MKRCLALLVLVSLIALNSSASDFIVTWRDCEQGLTHHSCLVDIKNLDPAARNFDLSLFFSDTSYQLERTSSSISEWKGIDTEFYTYDTRIVEKTCYVYDNQTGTSTPYDCSYSESYQNGTEIKKLNQWKSTKAQLTKKGAVINYNYGLMVIPKSNSKPKYDDFGSVETTDGTKYFKVEWETPLVTNAYGWGSAGKIGFFDDLTGIEYHPYWNESYPYKLPLNTTLMNNGLIVLANGALGDADGNLVWVKVQGTGAAKYFNASTFTYANDSSELKYCSEVGTGLNEDCAGTFDGLRAAYFCENGSGNVIDQTGNGYVLKPIGADAIWSATAKIGTNSIDLTGTGDIGDTGRWDNAFCFDDTEDFSIEMYYYADTWTSYNTFMYMCGSDGIKWRAEGTTMKIATPEVIVGCTVPSAGTWNHYFLSYEDSTDNLTLYINGGICFSVVNFNTPWSDATQTTSFLGDNTGSYASDSKMDNLRLWERKFDGGEVYQLYKNTNKTNSGYGDLLALEEPVTNNPPYTTLISPTDNATDIPLTTNLIVTAIDPEGIATNVTFYKSDGSLLCTNLSVTNGSNVGCRYSGLAYDTTYAWYVNITDGVTMNISLTFNFTTLINQVPHAVINYPTNGSEEVPFNADNVTVLNVTAIDPEGIATNVTFYNAPDGSSICSNLSVENGSYVYCGWFLTCNTTYSFYVNITDGTYMNMTETVTFTSQNCTVTTTTTTTTTTEPGQTTTTLAQNLTGLMQVILDDRTISEHKICIYQLLNWTDNDTQTSGIRANLIQCFNSPGTYDSQDINEEVLAITIVEDADYVIKVQKQREDYLASPSNFLSGLLQNLGYLIMALIVILSGIVLWKKLR